jgi:hypothetical protein
MLGITGISNTAVNKSLSPTDKPGARTQNHPLVFEAFASRFALPEVLEYVRGFMSKTM